MVSTIHCSFKAESLKTPSTVETVNRICFPKMGWKWSESVSWSVASEPLQPRGPLPTRLLCPWDFSGQNTGVGCISFSRGSSWPRDQTRVSHITGRFFTVWATKKAQNGVRSFSLTRTRFCINRWLHHLKDLLQHLSVLTVWVSLSHILYSFWFLRLYFWFSLGPVWASVWRVGSAPGDSKGRPGLRTWLLVYLWELRPGFSPRRGRRVGLTGFGPGKSVSSHGLCEQRVRSSLWGENNQEISPQAGLRVGSDCSWISPETGQGRWVFSAFQGPSVCRWSGCRLKSCADAFEGIFSRCRGVFAT